MKNIILAIAICFLSLVQVWGQVPDILGICSIRNGSINGEITFVEYDNGPTEITWIITGLNESSGVQKHGIHIHTSGNLSDNCNACGGHFNPFNKTHGGPDSSERHVGDLGNIVAISGDSAFQMFDYQIKLGGENSVAFRSVVIHAGEDDLGASGDPSGNSGKRIACCTIIPVE